MKIKFRILTCIIAAISVMTLVACDNGNNGDGETPSSGASLRTQYVQKLAENVDKIPDGEEALALSNNKADVENSGEEVVSTASFKITDGISHKFEAENVGLGEDYYKSEYYISLYYLNNDNIEYMNSLVEGAKGLKETALTTVKQYGVWVDGAYGVSEICLRYKVSYNYNADILTIECVSAQNDGSVSNVSYYKVQSSYDINGNILIDYYYVYYENDKIRGESNLRYNENVIYTSRRTEYEYDTTVPSAFNNWDVLITETMFESVLEPGSEQIALISYQIAYENVNGTMNFIGAVPSRVIKVENNGDYMIVFEGGCQNQNDSWNYDMHIYDEYERCVAIVSCGEKNYNIVTGEYVTVDIKVPMRYINGEVPNNVDAFYVMDMCDGAYDENGLEDINIPYFCFSADITNDISNVYDEFEKTINAYQLYLNTSDLKNLINYAYDNHELSFVNLTAFNYTDYRHIKYDKFIKMLNAYKCETVSKSEIESYIAQNYVDTFMQVEDGENFKSVKISDTVKVSVDDLGNLTVSDFTIEVERRQIFIEEASYKIGLYIYNGLHVIELDGIECVYNGSNMTFSGSLSGALNFNTLDLDTEYALIVMLTEDDGSEYYERISNDITMNVTAFENFDLSTKDGDTTNVISFIYENGKIVIKASQIVD